MLYNIPGEVAELVEGIPTSTAVLPDGTTQGISDSKNPGYDGPCPPPLVLMYAAARQGDFVPPHRYFFRLYALDGELELGPGANKSELMSAMEGHVLGLAETSGKYTTPLGLDTKEGKGFLDTTGGEEAHKTRTPVRVKAGHSG